MALRDWDIRYRLCIRKAWSTPLTGVSRVDLRLMAEVIKGKLQRATRHKAQVGPGSAITPAVQLGKKLLNRTQMVWATPRRGFQERSLGKNEVQLPKTGRGRKPVQLG